ncbi:MAG: hypothetical protein NZM29_02935, partial [Nitrospira sp.]|nr:hypothetical protein [Nitrospira sp.]
MRYERTVLIGADHPSIAGHFPGRPIVPGAVVLRHLFEAVRSAVPTLRVVTGMPLVKFSSPLKPGELLVVEVDHTAPGQVSFVCRV